MEYTSISSANFTEAPQTTSDLSWNISSTEVPGIIEQSLALYHNRRRFLFSGIVLLLGVIGNSLALVILARKKSTKNSKYTLLLRDQLCVLLLRQAFDCTGSL
ncbi:unnamed protein product [Ceratitis capitata]|uniref:(Mediterranean fruit fly) hypothetical protein n=1 Tax=Ceratitis capitata TaxID=7213 RepID=A0A811UUN3_CERCA|nr:unnamed protein product [Ceratitis capitata]